MAKIVPADRVLNQKPNPWCEVDQLVSKYHPLNFAYGSPDYLTTRRALEHLHSLGQPDVSPFLHQYARPGGHPRLVSALGKILTNRFRHDPSVSGPIPANLLGHTFAADRCIDPMTEIIISVGSYGSLSTAFCALVNPGDEVLVIEPVSGCYAEQIEAAGGVYVGVPMIPPENTATCQDSGEFAIDWTQLESAITKKTRVLVINSPSSPTGKVLKSEELKRLADICVSHNLICIADEVFEWLVFPHHKHHKIASFPGMWERTVTVGSAGKTFGLTGWKIGWSVGPSRFITAIQLIQQNTIYTVCTLLQEALARTIEDVLLSPQTAPEGDSFFDRCSADLVTKRNRIASALATVGMRPIKPQAGFFMLVDISHTKGLEEAVGGEKTKKPFDVAFNDWMAEVKGLVGFPATAFSSCCCKQPGQQHQQALGNKFLQFCIARDDATMDKLEECIKKWGAVETEPKSKKCIVL